MHVAKHSNFQRISVSAKCHNLPILGRLFLYYDLSIPSGWHFCVSHYSAACNISLQNKHFVLLNMLSYHLVQQVIQHLVDQWKTFLIIIWDGVVHNCSISSALAMDTAVYHKAFDMFCIKKFWIFCWNWGTASLRYSTYLSKFGGQGSIIIF